MLLRASFVRRIGNVRRAAGKTLCKLLKKRRGCISQRIRPLEGEWAAGCAAVSSEE